MTTSSAGREAALAALLAASVPFRVPLRAPVRATTHRAGLLIAGPHGVGEFAPFPDHPAAHQAQWLAAAVRAAYEPWPEPGSGTWPERIATAVLVPAQQPELAAAIVAAAGCPVVKVKAPPGPDPVVERTLAAISDALAAVPDPAAHRLRLDANGQWGVDEACAQLGRLRRVLDSHPSPVAIEYVEQPCATVTECVAVRRGTGIPVALDESVRLSDGGPDPRGPVQLPAGAAEVDALVCKPIPLGGISATLALVQASRAIGVPVVISGSLDTSLGLSSVARVAALVSSPLAAGVGTGLLLAADLTDEPLLPMAGYLPTRRVVLSRERLAAADPGPATAAYWRQAAAVAWWAGAAERTAGLHAAVLGQRGMTLPW